MEKPFFHLSLDVDPFMLGVTRSGTHGMTDELEDFQNPVSVVCSTAFRRKSPEFRLKPVLRTWFLKRALVIADNEAIVFVTQWLVGTLMVNRFRQKVS